MNFDLVAPCDKCPFRTDIPPYLNTARVAQICDSLERGTFPCHKTVDYSDEDGEGMVNGKSQHCAGALIMLEHMELPSQMMRIAERVGMYDRRKLRMDSPVFEDRYDFEDAQERKR